MKLYFCLCLLISDIKQRPLYRSKEYDTSRDPQSSLSAGSQVLFGSMTKFVADMGDPHGGLRLDLRTRCYAYFHGKYESNPDACFKRRESTSIKYKDVTHAGTLAVFMDDWDSVRCAPSSGLSSRKGRKIYVATLGNFPPIRAGHTSLLA